MDFFEYVKRGLHYIRHGELNRPQYITAQITLSSPNHRLDGKRILITGGGRGLGFAFAQRCVDEGADVVVTGRDEAVLKHACEILGANAQYIVHDASDVAKAKDLFLLAQKKVSGKIDCLINNAGISLHEGNFRNVTEDGWDRQFDTNLKGSYFTVTEYVKYLESFEDKSGNIVVITSERGKRSDDIPYGLTKVATSSFVQAIASKVVSEGIRINAVGPGVTATEMTGFQKDGNLYAAWQPGNRVFIPEEIAEVVTFLLSDCSSCICGEVITCDKGRYICHW